MKIETQNDGSLSATFEDHEHNTVVWSKELSDEFIKSHNIIHEIAIARGCRYEAAREFLHTRYVVNKQRQFPVVAKLEVDP